VIGDYALFATAPYLAALCLVLVSVVRFAAAMVGPATIESRGEPQVPRARLLVRAGVLAVVVLHLVLLLAPGAVLRWNRSTPRLLLLEAAAMCFGVICSIAVVRAIVRHLCDSSRVSAGALGDLIGLTLVTVALSSGVALAVLYRWASSWSVVTLTPYVGSLLQLNPRVELVAATPFLVRLHVFSTFAIAALFPFTLAGSRILAVTTRSVVFPARRVTPALRRLIGTMADSIKRHLPADAAWDEQEN